MLAIGQDAIVNNDKLFSHRTKGTLIGFVDGKWLLHWLDGAPPLRILPKNLQPVPVARKFWMVAGDIPNDVYLRTTQQDVVREGRNSPARKFYSREEAVDVATRLARTTGIQYIILEAQEAVSDTRGVRTIG